MGFIIFTSFETTKKASTFLDPASCRTHQWQTRHHLKRATMLKPLPHFLIVKHPQDTICLLRSGLHRIRRQRNAGGTRWRGVSKSYKCQNHSWKWSWLQLWHALAPWMTCTRWMVRTHNYWGTERSTILKNKNSRFALFGKMCFLSKDHSLNLKCQGGQWQLANPRFVCDWYVHESANPAVGEGSKIQYMPPRAKKKSSSKKLHFQTFE